SPDGKMLASGSGDETIRFWNLGTHQQIGNPLTSTPSWQRSVAFSPDGKTAAEGGDDKTIRLWDAATHRQIGGPLTGHSGEVLSVAVSSVGKKLASGSTEARALSRSAAGTVRLWETATHRQIGGPLTGHSGPVNSVAF